MPFHLTSVLGFCICYVYLKTDFFEVGTPYSGIRHIQTSLALKETWYVDIN